MVSWYGLRPPLPSVCGYIVEKVEWRIRKPRENTQARAEKMLTPEIKQFRYFWNGGRDRD